MNNVLFKKINGLLCYLSAFVIIIIVAASILAPYLAPYDPLQPNMYIRLQTPSPEHILGTDALGRDLFSRILYGGRTSILLSLFSVSLSMLVGGILGIIAGFYEKWPDTIITILCNIFQSIPGSCFMIAFAGIMGPSLHNLVFALALVSWAGFSRIVRAAVLRIKNEPYMELLSCLGASNARLMFKHILPNIANDVFILFSIRIGFGLMAVSGLSFLGLGVQPPIPDWGVMLSDAMFYYRSYPYLAIIPGALLFLLVFSINTLGDYQRECFDIKKDEMRDW